MAIAVLAVLVLFVLPAFSEFYQDLGLQLPPITQFVFDSTIWFSDYGIYVLLFLALAFLGVYVYGKTPRGKLFLDRIILGMPVIGRVIT